MNQLLLGPLRLLHVILGYLKFIQALARSGLLIFAASLLVCVELGLGNEFFDVRVVTRMSLRMRIKGHAALNHHLGLRRDQSGHLLGTFAPHDRTDLREALLGLLSREFACTVLESQVDPSVIDPDQLFAIWRKTLDRALS